MKFGIEGNELESSCFQGNQSWKDHRWENVEDISCYVSLRQHLTSILMKIIHFVLLLLQTVTIIQEALTQTLTNFDTLSVKQHIEAVWIMLT